MTERATLGLDLGGSKLLAAVVGRDGAVLDREIVPTGRVTGPDRAIRLVRETAGVLQARGADFAAAGLGFPGLVDHAAGLVRSSIMLDAWKDVPLADQMARALEVPCAIDNDVNMAAQAELARRKDESQSPATTLFVFVGTGIGGAIAIDGRLYRGPGGLAGEIGNTTIDHAGERCWCGRRGCLNTLASGSAIAAALNGAGPLAEGWKNGDPEALRAVERSAHWLGVGLGNVINLLNPTLVVLGGGVAELGPRYLEAVRKAAQQEAFFEAASACRFELARTGYEAGAIGAGLTAWQLLRSGSA